MSWPAERLAGLPAEVVLPDIRAFASRRPDLVVEMAHPAVTRQGANRFMGALWKRPPTPTHGGCASGRFVGTIG
ncbi:MAG: hypothetical protein ABSD29_12770 [Verrucomicrobiota bacterium]